MTSHSQHYSRLPVSADGGPARGTQGTPTLTVDEWRKMAVGKRGGRKEQPETGIRRAIRDYLEVHGWMVTRIVQSALSEPGIPDLVAIRGGATVWIEVKQPKGKGGRLSADQAEWLACLEDHGGHYIVARSVEDVEHLAEWRRPTKRQAVGGQALSAKDEVTV